MASRCLSLARLPLLSSASAVMSTKVRFGTKLVPISPMVAVSAVRHYSRTIPSLSPEIAAKAKEKETESVFEQAEPDVTAYSYEGISQEPFSDSIKKILMEPVDPKDVEIKTDGIMYLPEIKYRRIMLNAFGPGGWALMPKSKHSLDNGILSREYALYCLGRFVSQARGEQQYFEKIGLATAQEAVKSNALVRCCKDVGIAHSLWDPDYITKWKAEHAVHVFAETKAGTKTKVWRRKDRKLEYPFTETTTTAVKK